MVERLAAGGTPADLRAGALGPGQDWGHPVFFSRPADPVFTLHCTESWGRCDVEGLEVRIPDAAEPADGSDAHLTVIDEAAGWEFDLWNVHDKPVGGGRLDFAWGGRTRIDGAGLGAGATAAQFGSAAGLIRAAELRRGRIDHALFMVVRCDNGTSVYPAAPGSAATRCSDVGLPDQAALPLGAHLQLDMSQREIDALPVAEWKRTILRALSTYGAYVGDTGDAAWSFQVESPKSETSFGRPDPLAALAVDFAAPAWDGVSYFDLGSQVPWRDRLRVIDSCALQRACS